MSYTHLWLDVVAGLKKEGWMSAGGNYTSWLMLRKGDKTIKVYLKDYKKVHENDINLVVVRYS